MNRKILIAFYKGKGNWIDKLVRLWTNSIYSHVELVVGSYWYTSSPREGGVVVRQLNFNTNNWDFVEIEIDNESLAKLLTFIKNQIGKKYDYFGIIFSQIFPLNKDEPEKWFCSELIAQSLMEIGYLEKDKDSAWYSPKRLYQRLHVN